jgi:hypothetical protein
MELAEILGGAPAPVENAIESASTVVPEPVQQATEPTTTVEQPAESLPPRDERGRWVSNEAQTPAAQPTHEEPRQQHTVPVAAMLEERRKRQELEARIAQMQQTAQPQVKDEDFWQSPVQTTQQMLGRTEQTVQQQIQNLKYELAEDLTRSQHTDYDEVRNQFVEKVHAGDPWAVAIAQQMGAQPNPAKFVYDQTRRLGQLEQIGDLNSYRSRIEAEVRAQVLKELQLQSRPQAPVVPQSLNSEPSAALPSGHQGFEPTPLNNLFDRNF